MAERLREIEKMHEELDYATARLKYFEAMKTMSQYLPGFTPTSISTPTATTPPQSVQHAADGQSSDGFSVFHIALSVTAFITLIGTVATVVGSIWNDKGRDFERKYAADEAQIREERRRGVRVECQIALSKCCKDGLTWNYKELYTFFERPHPVCWLRLYTKMDVQLA